MTRYDPDGGLDFVEVGRRPHTLRDGVDLVLCVATLPKDGPDDEGLQTKWWVIRGPEGAVQFMEIPLDIPGMSSGDFGLHVADPNGEDCPLIGRCTFSANGWVGSQISEQLARHDPNGENPTAHASVVWGTLLALYYGYLTTGPRWTIVLRGGPLNDHDDTATTERTFYGDELPDELAAIGGGGGEIIEPRVKPPAGVGRYRRDDGHGLLYVWTVPE